MSKQQFHYKEGFYAERQADGSVLLFQTRSEEQSRPRWQLEIDADSWASLVAAVSKQGANSTTWQAAQTLHTDDSQSVLHE